MQNPGRFTERHARFTPLTVPSKAKCCPLQHCSLLSSQKTMKRTARPPDHPPPTTPPRRRRRALPADHHPLTGPELAAPASLRSLGWRPSTAFRVARRAALGPCAPARWWSPAQIITRR